jgi:transglutaminase-like putative cysteine protease
MPTSTERQKVLRVEPVGMPYEVEEVDGQRIALFKFDQLQGHQAGLFGWRALLEVRGIRYQLTPTDVQDHPPLSSDYQNKYLVDDDELAMDQPIIRDAARDAIGSETNILRQVLNIRDYVYDKLSYGIKPHIDTPDVVLRRGIGSCGEYVGLLLALLRLNGIACRTVGRYKCPPQAERQRVPLQPDFNHVWIEFYIPDYGWVPMESNVDDIYEGGPYPTRFFMALPWYHIEMSKDVPFEKIRVPGIEDLGIKIGELAINHVRFTILDELPPPDVQAD